MRSNEERAAAVRRRVKQLEAQRRKRRARIVAISSVAACLIIIAAVSFAMPALDGSSAVWGAAGAGSIFSAGVAGYIVIGVLGFALGVAVTLLGIKLRAYWKPEDGDD